MQFYLLDTQISMLNDRMRGSSSEIYKTVKKNAYLFNFWANALWPEPDIAARQIQSLTN